MRLDALIAAGDLASSGARLLEVRGDLAGTDVSSLTLDSRVVHGGALYCCVPGTRHDGHDFAAEAVAAGAAAVLGERVLDVAVPQIVVSSVRPVLGPLASALHGHPSEQLTVIGVTGTNGKTTTAYLLGAIFESAGRTSAVLGTLTSARTTPEAPELQARLAELRDDGVQVVAMEVSSHALVQHRVDAVRFAAAILTNLSQDHLDYHRTMEEYFDAKARLFEPGRANALVVNRDDPWGRRLLEALSGDDRNVTSFSLDDATEVRVGAEGTSFRWDGVELSLPLRGRFNLANALAAATTAKVLGVGVEAVARGLASLHSVPGRFEAVDVGQEFAVVVDYAHTPAALEAVLRAAREMASGRLIVVFGCGGDRDRSKRRPMGEVATRIADLSVLTSDNPRSEDPEEILAEVHAGAAGPGAAVVEIDRSRAISTALAAAEPGDVVVIAGKGHESGQEIGGRILPFDDAAVAQEALVRILESRTEEGAR